MAMYIDANKIVLQALYCRGAWIEIKGSILLHTIETRIPCTDCNVRCRLTKPFWYVIVQRPPVQLLLCL